MTNYQINAKMFNNCMLPRYVKGCKFTNRYLDVTRRKNRTQRVHIEVKQSTKPSILSILILYIILVAQIRNHNNLCFKRNTDK